MEFDGGTLIAWHAIVHAKRACGRDRMRMRSDHAIDAIK